MLVNVSAVEQTLSCIPFSILLLMKTKMYWLAEQTYIDWQTAAITAIIVMFFRGETAIAT